MDANPPTVRPETRVGEIARLLLERGLSGVPVVAESGELIGLVTQADLVARHAHVHFPFYLNLLGGAIPLSGEHRFREEIRRITGRTAAEVMTANPRTVTEDTPLEDIATRMAEHGVSTIPVVRLDKLVGLITRADLVRLVAQEETATRDHAGG
jgi:CBS domain-containing protein